MAAYIYFYFEVILLFLDHNLDTCLGGSGPQEAALKPLSDTVFFNRKFSSLNTRAAPTGAG